MQPYSPRRCIRRHTKSVRAGTTTGSTSRRSRATVATRERLGHDVGSRSRPPTSALLSTVYKCPDHLGPPILAGAGGVQLRRRVIVLGVLSRLPARRRRRRARRRRAPSAKGAMGPLCSEARATWLLVHLGHFVRPRGRGAAPRLGSVQAVVAVVVALRARRVGRRELRVAVQGRPRSARAGLRRGRCARARAPQAPPPPRRAPRPAGAGAPDEAHGAGTASTRTST